MNSSEGLHRNVQSSPTNFSSSITTSSTAKALSGESVEFRTLKLFLYFSILTLSSIGNGIVFYLICRNRRLRQTPSNMLLLNLSACDFLTPLLSIPFDLVLEERGYLWPYGAFLCHVLWPASTLTATLSALTLSGISLDRFRLLMHPFTPRLTKTQIKFLIAGIHLLSLSIIVPYVVFLKLEDNMCIEQWPKLWYRQAYTLVLFMTQYALPLLFMTTVYTLALIKLYNVTSNASSMRVKGGNISSRRLREVSVHSRGVSVNPRDVSDNSRKVSESLRTCSESSKEVAINSRQASANLCKVTVSSRKVSVISRRVSSSSQFGCETSNDLFGNGNRIRRLSSRVAYNMKQGCELDSNVRVTKLFIAIVAIFAIFMLPNQVLWLWIDFGAGLHHEQLNIVKIICWLFTYTNCVCNPIIFITFFKDFRSEVMSLPKRLWKRPGSRLSVSRRSSHESENTSPASPVNILSTLEENESCMD